jgi:hypothetical protein
MPTPVSRVRQPHKAKEPLCGNQPANLSLVIAEISFPPYSAVLIFSVQEVTRRPDYSKEKK